MNTPETPPGSPTVTRQIKSPVVLPGQGGERGTWVQTERKAHEAWARLVMHNGRAAALLHLLVARLGDRNAVVISRATLASMMGCSEATVKRATRDLKVDGWIQTVALGGKGGVNAFVVNKQVAWQQDRSQQYLAVFDAAIVANYGEQDSSDVAPMELRTLPSVYPGEMQLPSGAGETPPSQPWLDGVDPPDMPAIVARDDSTPSMICRQHTDGTWEGVVRLNGQPVRGFLGRASPEELLQAAKRAGLEVESWEIEEGALPNPFANMTQEQI